MPENESQQDQSDEFVDDTNGGGVDVEDIPEDEYDENSFASSVVNEMRQNEEDRMNERWKGGRIGKINKYLNTTRMGRWIKTTGQIALGTGVAATAASLSGPAALVAAPIAYALGKRAVIDGAIEGIQGLVKGNRLRIALEGKKQDQILMEDSLLGLEEQLLNNEISEEEYYDMAADLVHDIRETEEMVIQSEKSNIKWEGGQKLIRGIASTLGTFALGYLQGVPLGTQNFDGGASHVTKLTRNGFDFIYNANEQISQAAHSVWGQASHSMGGSIPKEGLIGLGTAMTGLFAKTATEFSHWWKNRDRNVVNNDNFSSNDEGPGWFEDQFGGFGDFQEEEPFNPGQESAEQPQNEQNTNSSDSQSEQASTDHEDPEQNTTDHDESGQDDTQQQSEQQSEQENSQSQNGSAENNTSENRENAQENPSGNADKNENNQQESNEPSYTGDPFNYDRFYEGHGTDIDEMNFNSLRNNIERIIHHQTLTLADLESRFRNITDPDLTEVRKLLVLPPNFNRKMLKSSKRKAMLLCHPDHFSHNENKRKIAEMLFKIINTGTEKLERTLR